MHRRIFISNSVALAANSTLGVRLSGRIMSSSISAPTVLRTTGASISASAALASTAILIPKSAFAFLPAGKFIAGALIAIFYRNGLRLHHLIGLPGAREFNSPNSSRGFHDSFNDQTGVDYYGKFKFENGKIAGVTGNRPSAGNAPKHPRGNIQLNRSELAFASNPRTLDSWGALTPETVRTVVSAEIEESMNSASRTKVRPLFARGWSSFEGDEAYTVAFGETRTGDKVAHVVDAA